MTLLEPDVALTDFALATECALFAGWLLLTPGPPDPLRRWFIALFAALCAGSLLGGITHGFFGPAQTDTSRALWLATLISIAVAALACWGIGAHLLLNKTGARRALFAATALFIVNVGTVLFVNQTFAIAILFYAPAVIFVLAGLVAAYARCRAHALLPGVFGVALSLAAAVIQHMHIGAFGLSHNALYHVVQGAGLLLIFATAHALARRKAGANDAWSH